MAQVLQELDFTFQRAHLLNHRRRTTEFHLLTTNNPTDGEGKVLILGTLQKDYSSAPQYRKNNNPKFIKSNSPQSLLESRLSPCWSPDSPGQTGPV